MTLLMHPNISASALCKETGIPDSKIYYALDALSKKGMITVQKGNPNIYLPTPPREAISNLKTQLTENFNGKIREADALVDLLTPLYENAEKSEELEVAYIIKGRKNIINRMKALIETARKEITIFIAYPEVFRELKESLTEAREKRRVKLNIAVTREGFEDESSSHLGEVRILRCSAERSIDSLGIIISDMKTLLTVSDWTDESALLTQDQNLIGIAKDYYENPSCCESVRTGKRRKS